MIEKGPTGNTQEKTRNSLQERKERELKAMQILVERAENRRKEGATRIQQITLLPLLQKCQTFN